MRPQTSTLSVNKLIVDQQGYQYDDAGNITEQVRNGQATRYQYDAEDRLTLTRSALGSVQRLGYDAEGNRTFTSNASGAWLYNDKQQLVKRGSGTSEVEYRWGVTGDLLEETRAQATTTYQYNAANQLVTVSRNHHILAEYHYDAFGRRIGKWVGGTQQWFVYSPEGLLAQLDGHGQMQQAWGWEPGTLYGSKPLWQADLSPESTLKTAKVAWLIADNTGTPLLALNDQGQTVWKGTRDPFAAVVPNVESQITVNLRYAGQYADAETGLYYNGFRYYDPLTGRYLQPDPLGLSGGLNSYVYALNNPLSYIDPEGQFPLIALLKPMAYFVGGWAVGEAMDYLFSYLPDNECNPLLSPRNWAQTMSDFIPAGEVYKRIKEASAVWKLSFSEIRLIIKSAKSSYKNTTVVGHALSKHSGRHPETWGKMHGPVKLWHAQGMTHLKDVIRAPGEFKKIKTQKGDIFIEKRLSDGRGVRLNMYGTFKGFID